MEGFTELNTPYWSITTYNKGRRIVIELNEGIKENRHYMALIQYVLKLKSEGINRINADHIGFNWFDEGLSLRRGRRKLDLVYMKGNQLIECELKTGEEIMLDRSYVQVKEQAQNCENFILLVPREKVLFAEQTLQSKRIYNVTVDSYD